MNETRAHMIDEWECEEARLRSLKQAQWRKD